MCHWLRMFCYNFARIKTKLLFNEKSTIVPQLSKCLKFEAVLGVLTDQMILI